MKAILHTSYGKSDSLQLKDVEKPTLEDDRVLVEVLASSLNYADYAEMSGGLLRLLGGGLRRPKNPRMGRDIAGRVEAVGKNVTQFHPGDDVFGAGPGARERCRPDRTS